jgi:hypothetical protein
MVRSTNESRGYLRTNFRWLNKLTLRLEEISLQQLLHHLNFCKVGSCDGIECSYVFELAGLGACSFLDTFSILEDHYAAPSKRRQLVTDVLYQKLVTMLD